MRHATPPGLHLRTDDFSKARKNKGTCQRSPSLRNVAGQDFRHFWGSGGLILVSPPPPGRGRISGESARAKNMRFCRPPGRTPFIPRRPHHYKTWEICMRAGRARECSERVVFFSLFVALRLFHIFPIERVCFFGLAEASERQMPLFVVYYRLAVGRFLGAFVLKT